MYRLHMAQLLDIWGNAMFKWYKNILLMLSTWWNQLVFSYAFLFSCFVKSCNCFFESRSIFNYYVVQSLVQRSKARSQITIGISSTNLLCHLYGGEIKWNQESKSRVDCLFKCTYLMMNDALTPGLDTMPTPYLHSPIDNSILVMWFVQNLIFIAKCWWN